MEISFASYLIAEMNGDLINATDDIMNIWFANKLMLN